MTSTQKYIEHATEIFNSIEKWNAFLELTKIKGDIVYKWYQELENSVVKRINDFEGINKKWKFIKYEHNSYGWYLNDSGEGSLTILFENNQFCLWLRWEKYDPAGIVNKYNNTKLFNSFFNERELKENNVYLAKSYNLNINGITDEEVLAYYAGNKGEEQNALTDKVVSFFIHFMNDAEIIDIIIKINIESKRINHQ